MGSEDIKEYVCFLIHNNLIMLRQLFGNVSSVFFAMLGDDNANIASYAATAAAYLG